MKLLCPVEIEMAFSITILTVTLFFLPKINPHFEFLDIVCCTEKVICFDMCHMRMTPICHYCCMAFKVMSINRFNLVSASLRKITNGA